MRKRVISWILILVLVIAAVGCSSKVEDEIPAAPKATEMPEAISLPEPSPTPEATLTPEATATPEPTPTMTPDELYEEAIVKPLLDTGNNYRLKRVLEKARAGDEKLHKKSAKKMKHFIFFLLFRLKNDKMT